MKKLLIVLLVFVLSSCSLAIMDGEGFRLFQYGQFIGEGKVCIQSHDGFLIGDNLYNETVENLPVTIINVLQRDINVKITDTEGSRWVVVTNSLTIEQ